MIIQCILEVGSDSLISDYMANPKTNREIQNLLQQAYWNSLQKTLSFLRSNGRWWIHDYTNRSFDLPFGKLNLKICRVKNLDSGRTERILPEFTIPFFRQTCLELPSLLMSDNELTEFTSDCPSITRKRLKYLKYSFYRTQETDLIPEVLLTNRSLPLLFSPSEYDLTIYTWKYRTVNVIPVSVGKTPPNLSDSE